ncbi:MAG TPA: carboxypeptidase regulatory-like domain-containing protein [Acidobacteriaceae bacterium]|jgi:hypothetical protein
MKSFLRVVVAAITLSCMANHVAAQTSSATISGHIVDQTKGAVANAVVNLINEDTSVSVTTRVNSSGDFAFPSVQPGTFSVVIQAPGYKEMKKVHLTLLASQNLSAGTIVLQVGEVSQTVTVSADITPLQTTSAERSAVLDNAQMENLLAIGRDAMALTRLNPGVVGGGGSSSLSTTGTPTVNGINSQYNLATVDGVPGNTRGGATMDTPPNMDAIQEVTMLESSYSAANGKVAGANFNFVTKNGTRQFHGGVYYYFRNEDLNANSYFNKFNGANIARPRYRYNTYGVTLGGPIYWPNHFNSAKNKLFFFFSYEASPIRTPDGTKFFRMPTLLETQGNFSQTYQQNKSTNVPLWIRNPSASGSCSATAATAGPGCFTNNSIPSSSINSQGLALLQIMYNNTIAAHPENYIANNPALTLNNYNYTTNNSSDKSYNQQIVRVDYDPTDKLHLYARVSEATINNNGYASTTNKYTWLFPANYQLTEPSYALNVTYTFSPNLVNEFNFGASAWNEYSRYDPSNIAKVTLGASGFNLPSLYPGVNPLNLFPGVTFGGVTNAATYGWDSRFPFNDNVLNLSFSDGLTKVSGPHNYKFGVDFETDTYLQTNHNRVGTFAFDQNSSNPNDTNFAFTNAELGNLNTYTQVTQILSYDPRTTVLDFYAQDTWKVNDHLVLDYGLRTSYSLAQKLLVGNNFVPSVYNSAQSPALYQPNTSGTATDPTTGTSGYFKSYVGLMVPNTGNPNNGIVYANTPGWPSGTTYNQGLFWQPRFGFAYSTNAKTVIRGHYGIFYNSRSGSGQEGDLTNNAPSTNSPTQYYSSINASASNYYLNAGNLSGPFSIGHALPLHMPLPYTEEVSLGVQRQIPFGAVVDVAYVGTFTKHASRYVPINTVSTGSEFLQQNQYISAVNSLGQPTAVATLPDNFFRPYPGFSGINMQQDDLQSNYNSLQARVTRRLHNGLEFGVVYTYSKTMDYGTCSSTGCSDSYNFTSALFQNLRAWNYGPASYDIKHNLAVNYLWALPKASRLWDNFATRAALDGWQISGIVTYLSGAPAQVGMSIGGNPNIIGGGDGARAVLTCDPMHNAQKTFTNWFNSSCVTAPTPGQAYSPQLYTSAGVPVANSAKAAANYILPPNGIFSPKVNFFLPGDTDFDTALFKNMPLNEKGLRLQLRVETYNTFNHSEFNAVNGSPTFNVLAAGAPGVTPNTYTQTNSQLGQLSGTASPRLMQLALRLDF